MRETTIVQQGIREKRKELLLYILDVVLFGIVVSSFSWTLEMFIPKESAITIFVIALWSLIILAIITFKIIVSPTKIQESMSCALILNLNEISVEMFDPVWYDFATVGAMGFNGMTSKFPKNKEKLKEKIDFKDKIFKDFGTFSIIEWLKSTSAMSICLSGYGRSYSPIRFKGKKPEYKLPEEIIDQNLFLKSVESHFPLNLPENMTLHVENGEVILDHRLIKIVLKVSFNQYLKCVDSRTRLLLDISKEERESFATISGFISFNAEFKFRSFFSRNTNDYYNYANNLLENLKRKYSWSEFLKTLKEYAFWKHLLKDE